MVTLGFFVILPLFWQFPICLITAELTTTFQVRPATPTQLCACHCFVAKHAGIVYMGDTAGCTNREEPCAARTFWLT